MKQSTLQIHLDLLNKDVENAHIPVDLFVAPLLE